MPSWSDIAVDEALTILVGDGLLDPLGRYANGEIGGVAHERTLGDFDLQIDLAARLLEQAIALGGRRRLNPCFFRRDLLDALRAQRLQLSRQRLHLPIDFRDLRGGRLLHLGRVDEVATDLRAAAG